MYTPGCVLRRTHPATRISAETQMKTAVMVIGAMLVAANAWAADVDGRWTGSIETPMGAVNVEFAFKADGNALSGTTTGPDGTKIEIKDGKIDGQNIAFAINIDFGGMVFTLPYTGVVSPEKIDLKMDFAGMPIEFTVVKAKE
jgi:hypothetical protein